MFPLFPRLGYTLRSGLCFKSPINTSVRSPHSYLRNVARLISMLTRGDIDSFSLSLPWLHFENVLHNNLAHPPPPPCSHPWPLALSAPALGFRIFSFIEHAARSTWSLGIGREVTFRDIFKVRFWTEVTEVLFLHFNYFLLTHQAATIAPGKTKEQEWEDHPQIQSSRAVYRGAFASKVICKKLLPMPVPSYGTTGCSWPGPTVPSERLCSRKCWKEAPLLNHWGDLFMLCAWCLGKKLER